VDPQQAIHCTYDNKTCFQAQSVPVIFDVSSNIGYTTGGMNLTVEGYGFEVGNITATVDGKDCVVTGQQQTSFSCEVQTSANVSVSGLDYIGSNGLRRKVIHQGNLDIKKLA